MLSFLDHQEELHSHLMNPLVQQSGSCSESSSSVGLFCLDLVFFLVACFSAKKIKKREQQEKMF